MEIFLTALSVVLPAAVALLLLWGAFQFLYGIGCGVLYLGRTLRCRLTTKTKQGDQSDG